MVALGGGAGINGTDQNIVDGGSGGGAGASQVAGEAITSTQRVLQNTTTISGIEFVNIGAPGANDPNSGTSASRDYWAAGGGGGAGGSGARPSFNNVVLTGNSFSDGSGAGTRGGNGGIGKSPSSGLFNATIATQLNIGLVVSGQVYFAGGGAGLGNFNSAGWTFTGMSYSLSPAGGVGGGGGGNGSRTIYTSPGTTVASSGPGAVNTGGGGRASGNAGGSGVILIRYLATASPTMSGVSFSVTPRKSTATTINFTMNVPGTTQFRINGKRIPNCLSRTASGSGNTYTSTCTWKPSFTGSQMLSVLATPSDASISPATYFTGVSVVARTANR